ncbi:MAG: hypothetical protein GXO39_01535 [Thermotogae bacterium]|nr:hypothetical protein [Thermotogota bacterium]
MVDFYEVVRKDCQGCQVPFFCLPAGVLVTVTNFSPDPIPVRGGSVTMEAPLYLDMVRVEDGLHNWTDVPPGGRLTIGLNGEMFPKPKAPDILPRGGELGSKQTLDVVLGEDVKKSLLLLAYYVDVGNVVMARIPEKCACVFRSDHKVAARAIFEYELASGHRIYVTHPTLPDPFFFAHELELVNEG